MSEEIIEAIFQFSHLNKIPLMLISSRNQIDYDKGYIYTTSAYGDFISSMRQKYINSDIMICRDHCGPGFRQGGDTIDEIKNTITEDLSHGFDLLHIDLCHLRSSHAEQLWQSADLIKFAKNIKPYVLFEIGTDENTGNLVHDANKVSEDMQYFSNICDPAFYVVQTGSLVKEISNIGTFDIDSAKRMKNIMDKHSIRMKEHNADYLSHVRIYKRKGIVDAMNIAPQLGVIQTLVILLQCSLYGISCNDFMNHVYSAGCWKKWLINPQSSIDKLQCVQMSAHYHYRDDVYRRIIDDLQKHVNVQEVVAEEISKFINYYLMWL